MNGELSPDPITAAISDAFPSTRPGPFHPLVNSTLGFEPHAVLLAFEDKQTWTELDAEWLDWVPDDFGSALSFLSDEAACFYLPAYLIADLGAALERVDPVFYLTHGLEEASRKPWLGADEEMRRSAATRERWKHLSCPQARCVVQYLEWKAAGDSSWEANVIGQALSFYWYEKAAPTP